METVSLVYSVKELAAALGVGRATAQRIAREVGVRVSPRRLVVPKATLDRWLEEQRTGDAGQ